MRPTRTTVLLIGAGMVCVWIASILSWAPSVLRRPPARAAREGRDDASVEGEDRLPLKVPGEDTLPGPLPNSVVVHTLEDDLPPTSVTVQSTVQHMRRSINYNPMRRTPPQATTDDAAAAGRVTRTLDTTPPPTAPPPAPTTPAGAPPRPGGRAFALMGQFNYAPAPGALRVWSTAWSRFVGGKHPESRIYLAAPHGTKVDAGTVGQVVFYKADKGWYSPIRNLARVVRLALAAAPLSPRAVRGVLYIHDDMLVTPSLLGRLGGPQFVGNFALEGAGPRFRFRLVRGARGPRSRGEQKASSEDQVTIHDGAGRSDRRFTEEAQSEFAKYPWRKVCTPQLRSIIWDPRLAPFWEAAAASGDDFLPGRARARADFLYVPLHNRTHARAFLTLLDVLAQGKVFLECALETAAAMMHQRFGDEFLWHHAKLCTQWGALRSQPTRWIPRCFTNTNKPSNKTEGEAERVSWPGPGGATPKKRVGPKERPPVVVEAFHPIKLGKTDKQQGAWQRIFHQLMVTGRWTATL